MHDFANADLRHTDRFGQGILGHFQRLEEVLSENVAGMGGGEITHGPASMIIDNFYIERVTVLPSETDAPLVINADAVLTRPIPKQSLEPVPGRHSQIIEGLRIVQLCQLP